MVALPTPVRWAFPIAAQLEERGNYPSSRTLAGATLSIHSRSSRPMANRKTNPAFLINTRGFVTIEQISKAMRHASAKANKCNAVGDFAIPHGICGATASEHSGVGFCWLAIRHAQATSKSERHRDHCESGFSPTLVFDSKTRPEWSESASARCHLIWSARSNCQPVCSLPKLS